MKEGTARLMMTVGAIVYAALMVLQLMTRMFDVALLSFASHGILVQTALFGQPERMGCSIKRNLMVAQRERITYDRRNQETAS